MGFRYRHWTKYCLSLAVLFCLILPGLKGITMALDDSTDVKDKRLHYIVRHWHADGTYEDDDEYLKEGDSTVTIHVKQNEGETFSGFATAAGHAAVATEPNEDKPQNSVLKISYDEDIHLVKVHAFYKDTNLEKEGNDLGSDETKVSADGKKQYNTSKEGLHTDKTAKGDGRDFELTLESWYVENNQSDVGMVLDASGSMAFTSNDLEPIKMSKGQIEKYGKMKYIPQDEVNNILNPFYTDNSKLAYSGYTYFVYDPTDDTKEYVPIGYWNGIAKTIDPKNEELTQKSKLSGYYPFNENDGNRNRADVFKEDSTQDGSVNKEIKVVTAKKYPGKVGEDICGTPLFTNVNAYNNTGKSMDLVRVYREKQSGASLLDIKPQGKSFTISFAVKGSSEKPVVWIGNRDQSDTGKQAWYAIYADTKSAKTKVSSGIGITTENNDIDNDDPDAKSVTAELSKQNDWNICTYVFKENEDSDGISVSIYVNNERKDTKTLDDGVIKGKDEDVVILLGGSAWQQDYGDGDKWKESNENAEFLMDELYFYDCALSKEEVSKVYEKTLTPVPTDIIYAAATPSDKDKTMAKLQNANPGGKGWYYVSSDSNWTDIINKNLMTAKRYHGIPADEVIFNQITDWPKGTKDPTNGNTDDYIYSGNIDDFKWDLGMEAAIGKKASDNWNGSIIFFIDKEGYLRCFYNTGKKQKRGEEKEGILNTNRKDWTQNGSYCSYVYKKEDLMRIKTEALQRALGSFVTRLSEVSPKSRISAVRFSTDNIKNLETLVLQNWTSNTVDSTGMLGLLRGNRTILDSEISDGVEQYNYSLTGGTATVTGLEAYLKYLDDKLDTKDSQGKSLIIFTDGKDTADKSVAIEAAEKLKKKGYKIYCVMLQSAGNKKEEAMGFLNKLASQEDYVYYANDVDDLTEAFTKEILNRIVNNLPDYTVKDYIDPRFDLVNADGSVVYLNADGNILVDGKNTKVDSDGYKIHITETIKEDAVGTVGENARLFYDQNKDMYYLKWTGQTIPGCSIGAEHLNVWKTRIKVRAKKDFIGGNAVITNGNAGSMNMVFHDDEDDVYSGADNMKCEKEEETGNITKYPSKGFPRTTVNVALLNLKLEDAYQKIYMGETIVPEDAFSALAGKVEDKVYYEYMERFEYWISQQKDGESQNLLAQLKAGNQIRIPYYYLPDKAGSNQAGKVQPVDQIGWLTYGWKDCDKNGVLKSNPTYSSFETTDTVSRYYQLAVSYTPMTEEERNKETVKIISDQDYTSPKKAVGTEQKNEVRGLGMHQTDIVNGEIIVEAKVLLSDLKELAEKSGGKLKANQSFTLVRSYNAKESKSELKVVFSYTAKKLKSLKANKDGYVSIFSKPSDPLPIGQYTMKIKGKTPFQFDTIATKKIKNGNSHFSEVYTKEKKESQYAAPRTEDQDDNSVSFYLGVPLSEEETKVNLNARLGHAVVTYTKVSEPETKKDDPSSTRLDDDLPKGRTYANDKAPATGDRADLTHVLILMVSSAALIIMPMMRKRQYR